LASHQGDTSVRPSPVPSTIKANVTAVAITAPANTAPQETAEVRGLASISTPIAVVRSVMERASKEQDEKDDDRDRNPEEPE
jgi:hypothetical protein